MFVAELFESQDLKKVVIMSGGFHPWTPGHTALYNSIVKTFPDADVWVAATNDTKTRPFPFEIKKQLAIIAGVPADRFVQVKIPFKPDEVTAQYDPNTTALIFVRSEKDRDTIKIGGNKKDGSPSYLQPYNPKQVAPLTQHGYMTFLPTVQYKAGATGITGATEIRNAWPTATPKQKAEIVKDLYPRVATQPTLIQKVIKLLDSALSSQVAESYEPSNSPQMILIPGFGQMRIDQAIREVDALSKEMRQYIIDGNIKAAAEYQKKVQPFIDAVKHYRNANAQSL